MNKEEIEAKMIDIDMNGMKYHMNKDKWNQLSDINKKLIKDFDLYNRDVANKGQGIRKPTRIKNLDEIIRFALYIDRPLSEVADDSDILHKFFREDFKKIGQNTKYGYVSMARKFYKWITKNDNPLIVQDFKGMQTKKTTVTPSMVLSQNDVKNIVKEIPDPQRKAGLLVLFDTGCRPDEFLNMKRNHITNVAGQWYIDIIEGKTGTRTLPLILSAPYLELWYNRYHPFKDKDDAPLWISRSNRSINKPYNERRLHYSGLREWVKKGEKVVGRRLWVKLFRHSRMSDVSDTLSETKMRIMAGWTSSSKMPATYIHKEKDLTKDLRKHEGLPVQEEIKDVPALAPVVCPRCKNENPHDVEVCINCLLPLKVDVAMDELKLIEFMRSEIYKDEKKFAREDGEFLDVEKMAEEYHKLIKESNKPGRKKIPSKQK